MVRDPYGAKMSKTRGNVVDPLGVIDEVGADALRFALVNGTAPGAGPEASPEPARGRPQLRQQDLERGRFVLAQRPAELPADALLALPGRTRWAPPSTGSWRAARPRSRRSTRPTPRSSSARRRACCTTRSGASTATGTWSWPRSQLGPTQRRRPAGRHVAGAGVGARPLPAAAAPGHAPHHRGDLGAACPSRPDDPDLLIVARWPDGRGGRRRRRRDRRRAWPSCWS